MSDIFEKEIGDAEEKSGEKLAKAIEEWDPKERDLIKRAREGYYSDFWGALPFPKVTLVDELRQIGAWKLVERVMEGEFDDTDQEAYDWYDKEGFKIFREDERELIREVIGEERRRK
ncbi:MAG: hypothetical protein L0Y56_02785 [Nitrospira sp.]|nr:hypothetical protein [Nitrospira sp.]